jgi:hypothetical protein
MRGVRTTLATVLCVAAAALSASAGAPEHSDTHLDMADAGCDDLLEEIPGRIGGFYENFWPNGVVPYEFVTGSTDSIPVRNGRGWTRVLSNVTFSNPATGPQLSSPTGFPRVWAQWDIVRCEGSSSNDGMDMKIVGGTLNASNTAWLVVQVEVPNGETFTVESPSSNVKFFVTRSVSEENQARFEVAAARWEAVADLNLRPKQSGEADYISVTNFNRNYVAGDVGHGSGARTLTMNRWDLRRTITHELGHSLGAKHEHQRPDRDNYVSVNTNIIQAGSAGNFNIDNGITIYPDLFYDYGSVMHYAEDAFLATGQPGPVITILDPDEALTWQTAMGTVDSLSYWDKKTMSFMYPESNWRFLRLVNLNPPSTGEFVSPWTVFDTAIADTPPGGRLIIMNPHNYVEPGVYSKAMTIEAPQGGVTIRAN